MTPTTDTRKRRNDLIFIAILVVTVAVLGAGMYFLRGGGDTVTVTVDDALYGTYPLAVDTVVEIATEALPPTAVCKEVMSLCNSPTSWSIWLICGPVLLS